MRKGGEAGIQHGSRLPVCPVREPARLGGDADIGEASEVAYPRGVGYPWFMTTPSHTSTPTPTRGYTASKDQLMGRLRRIEGQVRGIEKMVDDDRYCIDVLTQISAIQAALDKVALGLLDGHARHCMREGAADGRADEMATEMMAALGRLMKRG
jgi:CsoR family transcriptional regulator, copper-sensing transcriptional repressor